MFKSYDSSSLTSALRLYDLQYGLQYDLQSDSLKGFSKTLQPLSFSGSTLINPVFSADAPILDSVSSAPDMGAMGAMAALFQSNPAIIFAQALFTAMVDNGHVFEAQSNGCACCGHDHGMNAKTQIMKLSDQIQQLLDSGLNISNFNTLIGSISALGDVDADIFANSLQETAEAFAEAIFNTANEPANSDLPADTSTTGTITIGGSASGTRGSGTDEDWYAVELQARVQYTFIMLRDGDNPHEDPLLILYNPAGTEIDRNDDVEIDGARVNSNSFLTFTPSESGTYYLGASGWMATTGDYTIYAEEGNNRPDFTLDQAAFFLTSQFNTEAKWDKTDLTYDISALSDGAKTLALMAMDAWAEVSGLTFTAAAADADPDIDFNEDTRENGGRQAFTRSTISNANNTIISVTVTISANWNINPDGSANYALNSSRYQTYLHEVGHALGLGHSGPYNVRDVDEAGVSYHVYNQDAWNYTVMSYRDQGEAGTGTPRLVLTPQLVDIIAIQNFYGANGQTRSGDNVYGFNSTETGVLDFEGTFFNQGIRPPSLAIYDAGGTDTLDFSLYSANQVISLVEGSFSSIGDNILTDDPEDPLINNITIAVGTVIENAIGGSGDDSFIGNDSDNVFTGNGGNDTYVGGAGNDMVILALSQSRYIISVDETNGGRFLVIAGGTEGTDRINLADVEFVGFDSGQTIVTTASLADPIEFDDDGDGNIDRRVHLNADGRWARVEQDLDDDGTIDRITHYAFDDGGTRRVTRRDFDRDDDGIIDRTVHLDAEGRWQRLEQDMDDDGFIDRITHYAFDDGGRRSVTRRDFDRDDDGTIDRTVHLNAEGRWQRLEQDLDDDGFIDRITHYAFDDGGRRRVTRRDEDLDDDGTIDRTIHLNAEGRWERVEWDDDGMADRIHHYTFDSDGRRTRIDFDDDGDGMADRIHHHTFDSGGRRTRIDFDGDGDGRIDRSESYTYNANGRVSQTDFDDNNDGTTDRNEIYTYDVNGRLIQTDFDDNNDGRIDRSDRAPSSLDGINGFTLTGIDARDSSGSSVSSAGDVNGDGYDDLIIGAFGADPNGNRSGETYIVYGGASAPGMLDLFDLDGTNGFILTGIDANDDSGYSVSSAGDVNGDGYDDLIIDARLADPNGNRSGETYIVYGGASAPGTGGALALGALDGTNGFILNGIDEDDRSGSSVSSAGDVNGDGYDDLIIGARGADPNGESSGETYVVYGGVSAPGRDGVLDLSALDGTNGFILTGIDAFDNSGRSVSSAGDVNGDGYDDLIIGASGGDPNGVNNAGETYVIYGGASAPGGVLDLSGLNGTNGFILNGIDVGDSSGISVSSAGDVNGDGYDDLIIGARYGDPNGNDNAGETYVVYGGASAPGTDGVLDLSDLDGTNGFILNGIDADDRSGWSVSSAGDVNGDGYDDLIIGAWRADPNGDSGAGETYIIYGGASAPGTGGVLDLSMLDGNGFTLTGIDAGDRSGWSVSFAGDVNGDGYDDLIIGASRGDPNGDSDAGETYVIYGGDTGTESLVPVTASGTAAADNFTGNAGADSFTAIATNDVVRGGAGDDIISVTALDFAAIDGGTGADRLVLDGADLSLDLTGAGHAGVDSVEVFDLSGTGANSLVLDALAVFDVTEEREGGAASLDVLGDADDRVDLSGSNFALTGGPVTEDGVTYNIYRDGNAQLRVETGVQVQIPPVVFTSPAAVSARENQTAAYRAAAADDEGDPLVYSLSGTDAALFTIDANTGEVSFIAAPDFEMPGDADGDNVYDITVTASDGTNRTDHNVAIRVTNKNDNIPVFTSPAAVSARENQTAAYEAAATDADGDMLVYSLSGTDAALFTINATTGEVRFKAAPDFEMPGDADGDNVYDITVTASDGTNRTNHNVAITVTDEYDPVNLSSLDGSNGFTLTGIDARDESGRSVSSAGDVNGDGYDDLIIGAWRADPNGDRSGETYVVYGGASAPGTDGVLDLGALDGTNGFILNGIDAGDFSGRSVSSAGDVNGDGYDDLIIGAFGAGFGGETYIVYGGASAPGMNGELDLGALDGTNGFILTGINRDDESGNSVSSAGDVNGDGYDDLIIGAREADPNGDRSGETYVVYGGASAPGTFNLSTLDGTYGFILTGIDARDESGYSVSSAGDVNGDGYDDLIIGAHWADPNGDRSGETYVVYGGASAPGTNGVLDLGALDGTNGFILSGIDANDRSGSSVSSAGDVNGDGYDDLIIGAYKADPNGFDSGETYVVYGGASAPGTGGVLDLSDLDGTNGFILTGIDRNDYSGFSVSSAGDVNGDGYDDLIIGARGADPNEDNQAGETYIIYGGASAPGTEGELDLGALDDTNGFILAGIDAGDRSGRSVSSAGDVNGDGYDDLIIGANNVNPNGDSEAGETYVIYGGATGTESLTPVTASGMAAADNFTGNAGADSFTAIATNDVVRGGAGDDTIRVTALDFAAIDGGTGADTLVLDGAGLALDLTGPGHAGVDSVEVFDLSGTGANSLVLDALAVFDVTEEREGGMASLDVLGDADDRVDLSGSSFALTGTAAEDGVTYNVYRDGNAQLRIETGVQVQIPPAIFTSPAAVSVAENQTAAYMAAATDADGDTLVYSLSGTDAALFTINANTGEVSFIAAPDFEMPGDADGDNVYDITVTAFNGLNRTDHNVAITVTNENDNIPVFTSPAAVSARENRVTAYEAAATDADGDPLVYSLSGTDAALFTINADTGEVSFIAAPDFEAPGDDGGDNVYDITVTASDGTNRTDHNVAITVTDYNIPVFTSPAAVSVAEGQTAAYEAAATDDDSDPLVYSLSGTDAALFTINADTGEVSFIAAPNFEAPGDDGGDNVYDITVTAFDGTNSTNHNVAIRVTDVNESINLSSLDGTNGFTLTGINRGDWSGSSVSSAGDVNGDGYDDLIIGAWRAGFGGETYIVYGGASAPGTEGVLDLSGLDGSNGFILTGINRGDRSGFSVSSAGDVNGDGYDDLIIGAHWADPNGNFQAGETYIVYGGASAPGTEGVLDLGALDGTNGFILSGIDANDRSGSSVSSAGDVNGDGYDDLIIGARDADLIGRRRIAGETYVVYGGASAPGTDGVLDLSGLDGTNGFILNGFSPFDRSGFSVSSAGDVNGDGYDDLIIGTPWGDPDGGSNAGETYVVYGGASAPGSGSLFNLGSLNGINGFILTGIDGGDNSGFSVSSAGDINGDGYDDLIIGAPFADPNGDSEAGETYIVYGGANAPGRNGELDLSSLDGTNGFTLTGIDAGDRSGTSISSAGDVNGDGYDDLIIGAYGADPNEDSQAGETYIVYGGANAPGTGGVLNLGALDGTNGFILAGIDAGDNSGFSVSSAGDVNGDGYDDLIIGAYNADPNGDDRAGETYVIYGGATGTESLTPVTAQGMAAADNFTGNAGDDNFTAIATNDVVRGGAGDDTIRVTALDFAAIDGGTGQDTLVLDGAGLSLDLTGSGNAGVDSVEVFDLSGTGANSLVLDALAVFDVTEEREGGMASLDVLGDADDRVALSGSNFALTGTAAEDGVTYNIYRDGNAQLRVETGVQVQIPPAIFTSPAAVSVAENQMVAYEALATDADGDMLVYSLSGTDATLFTVNANTGEVSFIAAPDFEMPGDADGDNVYDITVTAFNGLNRTDHNVAITVTNENDNIPVFTSPAAVSAQENQTAAYEAAATDADGDTLVYSLSGTDAALFTIDANRGDVSFIAAPDFEMPGDADGDNVYDITVTASDGTNRTDHNVAITVTDDNIPVFTSPFVASARENQTAAYEAAAMDDEGDPLVYSLSGTDAALFTIDATTGEVSFIAAPDFEVPGDADGDNVYDITVTASDGSNRTDHNVAITVTDENENIPVFTSPAAASVAEGQSAVYRATATDADGDMPRYSLSGTDAALFRIGSTTGEVRFRVAPDFEMPGDADGDNVYDITVTASDGTNRTDHNVAITVTDGYDPVNLSSLDGSNGFTLNGINRGDESGFSVSSAGDVNGDGYDDLIIGASGVGSVQGEYGTIFGPGETYIVYGGANAPGTDGVLDLSSLDGTNGFTLTGINRGDESGHSVSSAGDINGDGYDDLIIGVPGVGGVQDEFALIRGPGEAYVVYGGATGADLVLDRSTLDGTNGFTLTGIDAYDQSGYSVSSAGDVNGDGYDDLIIGAPVADETYIVYGGASAPGTGGVLDLSDLDGTNGFILTGIDAGDRSGHSVSSAGDVNGDGYDDLIIGATGADPNGNRSGGETYVIYGGASAPGTGGVLDLSGLDGTNGFILTGIDAFDGSGHSVSSAGDINGDGYDDLIIGASGADPNGNRSGGETYVIYGGASAPGTGGRFNLSTLNGINGFILNGIDADDRSGISVSSAGDVNGDGYDDLIIGARFASPNGDRSGETYVIYGGANAPGTGGVLNLSDLDGTNGFIIAGIDARDRSGRSVSSAGDVNGDGYDDLIIGAHWAAPNGNFQAGETYIVYGGATGTESLVPVTALGTAAADNFTGNAGDDSFTAIATNDVVRGGAGNDTIRITALDFAAIDGGTGQDALVLDGAGLSLDLTGAGHAGVDSVEVFDLSGTGANSLVLDALAVFAVTEEREGGMASLDVLGDADDRVDLSSSFALTGTAAEDGVTYNVYRDGNAEVRIEDGVMVTLAATGSQSARFKTDPKIDTKTETGIDPVADPRTDTRTDPESGTRLDEALMNSDPLMNNDLWNNDLWDGLWADGVSSLDQPVHIDEDAILIPLSDPLSFGPLASGPLPGPWGDLMCWPGLGNHPAMQNDLAMILPEMEIVTAYMEGF